MWILIGHHGVESQPCRTMMLRQLGEPAAPLRSVSVVVCMTINEGVQRRSRQSDGRIVPMKAGDATGGKLREDCASQSCHAKQY